MLIKYIIMPLSQKPSKVRTRILERKPKKCLLALCLQHILNEVTESSF